MMIFADKLIDLRKKNGWSQEELAEKLEVSRQTVSKWEGAQSVPDLGRMLKLSEVLGVSTDYLMKDELDLPAPAEPLPEAAETNGPAARPVSMEEAAAFLRHRDDAGGLMALGTLLCILCPVVLILLGAAQETGHLPVKEDVAAGLGLIVLFLLIAGGVALFLVSGFRGRAFEHWNELPLDTAYGVSGMVRDRREKYAPLHTRLMVMGILLCVVCPLPIFVGMLFDADDFVMAWAVASLLGLVALGVFCIVRTETVWEGFQVLLEEEGYTREMKLENRKNAAIAGIYWGLVTAAFLAYSFITEDWGRSWITWPVAGVSYGVLIAIIRVIRKRS